MEKKPVAILILVLCIVMPVTMRAQTFDEWWRQKKTQIKYLGLQIAALKVYAGYLEKGYTIVQQGTTFINDIKHGEFDLHKDYFSSLSTPSPAVKNYSRARDVVQVEAATLSTRQQCLSLLGAAKGLPPPLADAARNTLAGVLERCNEQAAVLQSLVTNGQLQLTEGDRITRINQLYADCRGLYRFSLEVLHSITSLSLQQQKEQSDVGQAGALYGLP